MASYAVVEQTADYLIIDKAPGVSVHRDQDDTGLLQQISAELHCGSLYLVHRLDKMTSGLLILACHAQAAAYLSRQFQAKTVEKYYLALSDQKPRKKQGLIKGDMERSRRGSWKLTTGQKNPAMTRFFSCSPEPGIRLFLLRPFTGKTHQLRVALKSIGAAILGDQRYHRVADAGIERGYLHAWVIAFEWQGERREYRCDPTVGELFLLPSVRQQLEQWAPPSRLAWPASS
ncbi:TIGR01621 family pseudouridine synthase [Amphritea sp. 1_MG-2023]|uniref:TIGR01621 family pseudouridine synthase n=1 Tax=Amphritea sp. 1_MG-2023 TaxID=3062670 RepID=UPI0026E33845|nr:TIGR01621 family pseudouridine synthase [Amphritea sp. 1_MG-2023]MDO6562273.1 TIGR01621 family pseudouridine synthase [Amphritea sp. 1_MG-2023]